MSDPFLGEIRMFGGTFAPENWAYCHGQTIAITDNPSLYSLIGTTYGGDGRTTFNLPDFRSRCVVGSGTVPGGITKSRGNMNGNDFTTLTTHNLPPHSHPISNASVTNSLVVSGEADVKCTNTGGNSQTPEGKTLAKSKDLGGENIYGDNIDKTMQTGNVEVAMGVSGTITVSGNTSSTGLGQSFTNQPPYGVIDYIICTNGFYPQRPY